MKLLIILTKLCMCYSYRYPHDLRTNIIQNSCEFDIIRIKREDIMCSDYGTNKKYCNHFALSQEFVITNEIGIENKKNIVIKPYVMYFDFGDNKHKVADYYYTFTCSHEDNFPKLILNIVPKNHYDLSLYTELCELCIAVVILVLTVYICSKVCHFNINNNDIYQGVFFGYLLGIYRTTRRIYSE